ncbi:MAG: helix-turn-helix domain-containing protein [Pyrinomonadaceae bacterium]
MKLKAGEFYGTTAKEFAANSFRFTEKSYSPQTRLPNHSHEFAHFCLVLAGDYQERIGSRQFSRVPSVLVYYPADVSHAEVHHSTGRHFLVEIDFTGLSRVREYGGGLDAPALLGQTSSLSLAARMYSEFNERDIYSELALESIATELLIAASREDLSRNERKSPKWLARVKEYLQENYQEPPGLTELANAAGVHPTHMARVFRQLENCTAGEYVRRIRIDEVQKRIVNSNTPLVEIALETGFADQTHLTRSFKRATGMTPSEFRRVFKPR